MKSTVFGFKSYTECHSAMVAAIAEGLRLGDGREVSVMTHTQPVPSGPLTGGEFVFTVSSPEPASEYPDRFEEDEPEAADSTWSQANTIAAGLDAKALAHDVVDRLLDDSDARCGSLYSLISTIIAQHSEADYSRPHISPSQIESIGKYVASVAAAVVARQVQRAMDAASDRTF